MNYADAICIIILVIYIFRTSRKGIAYMAVSLFGKLLSIASSFMFCGSVSRILRKTPLFTLIKYKAAEILSLEEIIKNGVSLNKSGGGIKDTLSTYIMANDNSEIYKLFGVVNFTEYIYSYIANTVINIMSVLIVYFCVSVIISTMFRATGIITRLPVIKQANAAINVIAGFIQGTIVIWILMVVLMFFTLQGMFLDIYAELENSRVAVLFLEHNVFAKIIFEVIK